MVEISDSFATEPVVKKLREGCMCHSSAPTMNKPGAEQLAELAGDHWEYLSSSLLHLTCSCIR